MTQLTRIDQGSAVRAGPSELTGRDLMHGYSADDIAADSALVALNASLCRVIAGAPIQNKLVVFGIMARTAAGGAAAHRQQMIDELWEVANALGLVTLFGVTGVQDVLAAAFAGDAS